MSKYLLPEDDGLTMRSSGKWVEIKLDYLTRYINEGWTDKNLITLSR